MSLERSYRVTILELVTHANVVQARSAKAARTLARKNWQEFGPDGFKQEGSTITERINAVEWSS